MAELVPADPPLPFEEAELEDFFGQPKGLWILTLTEAWIAFSLFGVLSVLLLYIQKSVLQADHLSQVFGSAFLLKPVTWLYHPVGLTTTAAGIMGLVLALVYATPLVGSFIADRYFGRTRTVAVGAGIMGLGILLLASKACFVAALLLFLAGVGCVGCMKAQVGALFPQEGHRRSEAYQIYSLGIQIAVIVSPLLCSALSVLSWAWTFFAAAAGSALAFFTYVGGRRHLPPEPLRGKDSKDPHFFWNAFSAREKGQTFLVIFLTLVFALGALPNQEINDGYLLWGEEHYALTFFGHPFPVSDLISLDALVSSITAVAVLWFWQYYDRRYTPVGNVGKILLGTAIATLGPLVLALAAWLYPQPHGVNLWWGVGFHTLNDIGFAMSYSMGLALVSSLAPAAINTLLISFFTLHLCLANLLVGKLAGLLPHVSDVFFWLLHAGSSALALGIMALCALLCPALLSGMERVQNGNQATALEE